MNREIPAPAPQWIPPDSPIPAKESPGEGGEIQFDFDWIFKAIQRRWFSGSLTFLITALLCLAVFLKDAPKYTATVKLMVEAKRPVFQSEAYTAFDVITAEFFLAQVKLLQSRSLIRTTLDQVGIVRFHETMTKTANPISKLIYRPLPAELVLDASEHITSATSPFVSREIDRYARELTVTPDRLAPQILAVSFSAPDPEFAVLVVNTHAKAYMEYSMESNALYTDEFIEGLTTQVDGLESDIKSKNEAILLYKKEHGFFQLQGTSSYDPIQDIDDRLTRVREQLARAMEELTRSQAAYEALFDEGHNGEIDSLRYDVITSPQLETLRERKNEDLKKWAEIKDRYLENHHLYVSIENSLQMLDRAITEEILTFVHRAESAYDEALKRKNNLTDQEQSLIQEKYLRDKEWNALKSLEQARDQLNNQKIALLRDLQNAKSSLETQKNTSRRLFQIVDPAEIPNKASNRNWARIFLLVLAAAFSATFAFIFFLEFQDNTIRTPQQVEHVTGISVMGCIPSFLPDETSAVEGRIDEEMASPASEAFVALRTRFLFSGMMHHAQTILISSVWAKEGKSTISVNLASSLAMIGKRVLLVDCDLRKPALHTFFGESKTPGLADLIHGTENLDQVLVETDVPGLFLIAAGTAISHPSELLTSSNMDTVFDTLREEFDFIFVDSPPVLAAPDPTILSSRMDITLLVLRSGSTDKADLLSAMDHFNRAGGNVFSIILNGLSPNERSAYLQYGYGKNAEAYGTQTG